MKSFRKELWLNISARKASVNITRQVEEVIRESRIGVRRDKSAR